MSMGEKNEQNNPCLYCPGLCCSQNLINICTYDVWTIVRDLHVHPMDFVGFAKLGKDSPYNFMIDGSESSYCLVLNMKELPNGNRRCVFALDLPDPVVRCGVYSCRPIACRAYPLILKGNQLVIKPWALCSKNAWDKSQFERAYWRKELQRHDMEFSIHASLVAKWNVDMQMQPKMRKLNFRLFFDYFFEVYKQLEPIRAEISEEVWPGIWQQWRKYTSKGLNPLFLGTNKKAKTVDWSFWLHSIENAILQAKQNNHSRDVSKPSDDPVPEDISRNDNKG